MDALVPLPGGFSRRSSRECGCISVLGYQDRRHFFFAALEPNSEALTGPGGEYEAAGVLGFQVHAVHVCDDIAPPQTRFIGGATGLDLGHLGVSEEVASQNTAPDHQPRTEPQKQSQTIGPDRYHRRKRRRLCQSSGRCSRDNYDRVFAVAPSNDDLHLLPQSERAEHARSFLAVGGKPSTETTTSPRLIPA